MEEEEAEEDEEEKEVEKEEEEVEVDEEEFNLGKSDDQRVRLPQPPALLLRPKITKLEIISKTDKDKCSILSQHPINARGFKGLNDKCSPISSLQSSLEFCSFCLPNSPPSFPLPALSISISARSSVSSDRSSLCYFTQSNATVTVS